ncbi:MAG: serine/threonine-protein kinase [Planctomycetota bacterium]
MPTALEQAFVATAVKLELLAQDDGTHALAVADAIRGKKVYADVRTVLIGREMLTSDNADKVLAAMGEVAVFCPVCRNNFSAPAWKPDINCPNDNVPVKPTLAPHADGQSKALVKTDSRPVTIAAKQTDPLIGMTFGAFCLTGVMTVGATHTTYAAELKSTGQPFTVKVLTSDNPTARRRFIREAKYSSLIEHPNVVQTITAGEAGKHVLIVTEFIDGQSLDQLIAAQPAKKLGIKQGLRLILPVLMGLEAAHRIGVVHRNIKPTNVVAGPGGVKIINFSSARLLDEAQASGVLTAEGSSVGTPHYVAPEQIHTSKVDFRADVYAVGATLFHVIAGRPPFIGNVSQVVAQKVSQAAPALSSVLPEASPELDAAMAKMLARDVKDRFQTAPDAARALLPLAK